jgi:hypothetical protein
MLKMTEQRGGEKKLLPKGVRYLAACAGFASSHFLLGGVGHRADHAGSAVAYGGLPCGNQHHP